VLRHLRGFANWKKLTTVSRIRSKRWIGEEKSSEDRCRVRKDHGPEKFAILRHIALNLLKQKKTCKRGIQD
jgi:predicted transposase YbfD/YdcC